MNASIVIVLLSLGGATPQPRPLDPGAGVSITASVAPGADASFSALREFSASVVELGNTWHAPGAVPVGLLDAARGTTWLIAGTGPGKRGEPAELVRVGADGRRDVALRGLALPQRPALNADGSVVVFSAAGDAWTVHLVGPDGKRAGTFETAGAWVLPVPSDRTGSACFLVHDGVARVECRAGADATVVHKFGPGAVRDVFLSGGRLGAVITTGGQSRLVLRDLATGSERTLDSGHAPAFSPQGNAGTVAWSRPDGRALRVLRGGKVTELAAVAGRAVALLAMSVDGSVVVVRQDSIGPDGVPDGARAPVYSWAQTTDGAWHDLNAGGPVVHVHGVRAGVRP